MSTTTYETLLAVVIILLITSENMHESTSIKMLTSTKVSKPIIYDGMI